MSRFFVLLPLLLLTACPVGVPSEHVEDTWSPVPGPVDVLWVVDDSGSMDATQQAIGAAAASLLAPLTVDAVAWQMGVVTTDMTAPARRGRLVDGTGGLVLLPTTPGVEAAFAQRIRVGIVGSDMERGLEAAWSAVTPPLATHDNDGLLREGARLAVIVVSDEDDCSDEGAFTEPVPASCVSNPQALVAVDDYLVRFGDLGAVTFHALVETGITAEFEGCGGNNPGSRYVELARATAGHVAPLCGDFDAHLGALGEQLAGLKRSMVLSRTPDPATLAVDLLPAEGDTSGPTSLPEDPTRTEGWTLDAASNTIRFWGTAAPAFGETVRVRYRVGLGT